MTLKKALIFSGILFFVLISIYIVKEFNFNGTILKIDYTEEKDTWYIYSYETSNVKQVSFYATYSDGASTNIENLGNYYLNNNFNIGNIFGNVDEGKIEMKIDYEENGFYIYCYSNIENSNPVTLPSNEIFSYLPYSSLTFTPKQEKVDNDTFLIMQSKNEINPNTINVYVTINN